MMGIDLSHSVNYPGKDGNTFTDFSYCLIFCLMYFSSNTKLELFYNQYRNFYFMPQGVNSTSKDNVFKPSVAVGAHYQ